MSVSYCDQFYGKLHASAKFSGGYYLESLIFRTQPKNKNKSACVDSFVAPV